VDGWTEGGKEGRKKLREGGTNGWMDRHMNEWIDKRMNERMDG